MIKLSIVIPTKNRYEQLFIVVAAILKHIVRDDYEIVINDNSDDNKSAIDFVRNLNDNRVSYYYTTEKLSQSGNSNDALGKAKGKYVLFIGDDDTVSPYVMDAVDMMEKEGIECLSYVVGVYYWPNVVFSRPNNTQQPSFLNIRRPISVVPQIKNSKIELINVLEAGGVVIANLPRVYHGLVSANLLNKLKSTYGNYVVGSCPDMNLAVALSQIIDNYSYINYPLSISGVSSNSASGLVARSSHCAELEHMVKNGFLPVSVLSQWNPLLPKVWTGSTIYAQAVSEALKDNELIKKINYTETYRLFFNEEKWAKKIGWETFRLVIDKKLSSVWELRKYQFKSWMNYRIRLVIKTILCRAIKQPISPKDLFNDKNRLNLPLLVSNVESIDICMENLKKIPFV